MNVGLDIAAGFAVDAHDLLLVGDDAGFDAGGATVVRSQNPLQPIAVAVRGDLLILRQRHRGRLRRIICVETLRSARLRATLAAPPGMKLSRSNSTTGTGASGEMRRDFAPDELVEHDVAEDENARCARRRRVFV